MATVAKTYQTDVLKGLAIIAVITIHVTSAYLFVFEKIGTGFWQLKIVLDQLSRFSVPLFVAVSGFALTKHYQDKLSPLAFYWHQGKKLLPWYLVASVVLFLAFHWQPFTWKQVIFLGKGDYQLYFIPMIFQLYLLFPILRWLHQKWPHLLLAVALIFEIGLYIYLSVNTEFIGNNNGYLPDQKQYLFFGSWVFYFILGMHLAAKRMSSRLGFGLVLVGLIWSIVSAFNLLTSGMDLIVATRFTRLPVLLYATGLCVWLLGFDWKNTWLISLGKNSFQMYLWHTAILRLVLAPFLPYPAGLALSLVLSYLLARIIKYVV